MQKYLNSSHALMGGAFLRLIAFFAVTVKPDGIGARFAGYSSIYFTGTL